MRLLNTGLMALMLMTSIPSFADKHECSCDKACTEKCAKGEGKETCKCKACDCSKTGKCSHHKCEHKAETK